MDLAPGQRAPALDGLPRTRGDGPSARSRRPRRGWASPHTRGWTAREAAAGPGEPGFPAHAGMDPRRRARSPTRRWLPRTRGDGPTIAAAGRGRCWASPHTRGWTLQPAPRHHDGAGFPAHAGMDPPALPVRHAGRRLPRTRGDGPHHRARTGCTHRASPHTRGWTRPRSRPRNLALGFPAHAGMDPDRGRGGRKGRGLPRTRGDGPPALEVPPDPCLASPHTRGWTGHFVRRGGDPGGFPAHAGMDPPPRPRRRDARAASPHTRGWTRARWDRILLDQGFPAHAGMDPSSRSRRPARTGLPRTRGDGPRQSPGSTGLASASPHTRGWTPLGGPRRRLRQGFPAHAGMDHKKMRLRPAAPRLPRTRGDGPVRTSNVSTSSAASPHTRGWTAPGFDTQAPGIGFPAHAGMDRRSTPPAARAAGLPRTRGDGPSARPRVEPGTQASPHTRGWTVVIGGTRRD